MSEDDPYGQFQGKYPYETGHDYNERNQWQPAPPYTGAPESTHVPPQGEYRASARDVWKIVVDGIRKWWQSL